MAKIYILVHQTDYDDLTVWGADLSESAARRWKDASPYNDVMLAEVGEVSEDGCLPYLGDLGEGGN